MHIFRSFFFVFLTTKKCVFSLLISNFAKNNNINSTLLLLHYRCSIVVVNCLLVEQKIAFFLTRWDAIHLVVMKYMIKWLSFLPFFSLSRSAKYFLYDMLRLCRLHMDCKALLILRLMGYTNSLQRFSELKFSFEPALYGPGKVCVHALPIWCFYIATIRFLVYRFFVWISMNSLVF